MHDFDNGIAWGIHQLDERSQTLRAGHDEIFDLFGRLHCGVQRRDIRLKGNVVNNANNVNDFADLLGVVVDLLHGAHHL